MRRWSFSHFFTHQFARVSASEELFFRLDVDQDFGDFVYLLPHLIGHRVGDQMPLAHGKVAPHHHMQIHVVAEAHLAHKALFYPEDVRH